MRRLGIAVALVAAIGIFLASWSTSEATLELVLPGSDPVTFIGNGGFSADGLGQNGGGGTIQAEVPAGSTVENAWLYAATVSGGETTSLSFDGNAVALTSLSQTDPAGFSFSTTRADVTAIVAAKVGGGGGIFDFTVDDDPTSPLLDGVALVVIFSNPALPHQSFAVLDGGLSTTLSTTVLNFAEPIDTTVPGFSAILSLGIQFGYQAIDGHACGGGQFSTVDINGARLTSCAGNYDDGLGNNGALITVGGVGDSTDNPADPFATNSGEDDELYDISSFISNGDTSLSIVNENPSGDDSIFLAIISVTGEVSGVTGEICDDQIDNDGDELTDGEDPDCWSITLTPPTATNVVGTDHTVTATVEIDGQADVEFNVTDGPNAGDNNGQEGTAIDGNGEATFTYTGDGGAGTDTIEACVVDFPELCATATKTWVVEPTPTPTPTPTVLAATATPTPTPTPVVLAAALPSTGGAPSDGSSSALPWLAAIAGAIALIGSGSAWLAHQRRRVR
ncbi:MAG: hypothetical protein V3S20_04870 [Dehalococcoidia bacterium]